MSLFGIQEFARIITLLQLKEDRLMCGDTQDIILAGMLRDMRLSVKEEFTQIILGKYKKQKENTK